jgi:hypothetical protein
MDFNTWMGLGRVAGTSADGRSGNLVPTVGGFLVLKPSQDLTLQSGQAPSLVGNFTLQFNLRVRNTYNFRVQPQIYVITANSGFFESIRGSSRIIKGVLSEQDIIAAPLAPAGTMGSLARLIGGKALSFANRLSKMREHRAERQEARQEARAERKEHRQEVRAEHRAARHGGGLASRLM